MSNFCDLRIFTVAEFIRLAIISVSIFLITFFVFVRDNKDFKDFIIFIFFLFGIFLINCIQYYLTC